MKLYSGPLSLFTAKVRVALAEKGLPYEKVSVRWTLEDRYLPHHPEVVARNPKRQVPVLVDGDLSIYDSTVILEYLEDRYPDPPLYPREPAERARCRQLELEADELVFAPVWDLIEETFYPAGDAPRDPGRAARAKEALHARYQALDERLAGRDFLCGAFSVADIGSFVMLNAATTLGCPPDEDLANLGAWIERVAARDSVAAEVAESRAFLAQALAGGRKAEGRAAS